MSRKIADSQNETDESEDDVNYVDSDNREFSPPVNDTSNGMTNDTTNETSEEENRRIALRT